MQRIVIALLLASVFSAANAGILLDMVEKKQERLVENYDKLKEKEPKAKINKNIEVFKDVVYATHSPDNKLDIYVNKNNKGKSPVIIMIHGGGWLIGDKGSKNVAENKVNYFVGKKGYVFVSINYRMEKDNIHPQELSDVSEAINSVYRNISKFGGDQNKIVVMGHSAGAHLAALVGTNNKYLSALGVPGDVIKGIIPLDGGGFDLPYLLRSEAMVKDMGGKKKDELILERIRSTYNMAWGNYDQKTLVDASPVSHLSKEDYPFLLIESSNNKPHVVLADKFQEELIRNGIVVDRKDFALKHEEINDLVGIDGHELTKEVEKFLLKVFQ